MGVVKRQNLLTSEETDENQVKPDSGISEIPSRDRKRLDITLWLGAGTMLVVVMFACFVLPQTPGRLARASAGLIQDLPFWAFLGSLPLLQDAPAGTVAFLLIVTAVVAFVIYGLAIFLSWNREASLGSVRFVIGAAFCFFVISMFALPNLNTDIFNYITRARVAAVHNSNPHYVPADAFPEDPIYPYASHRFSWIVGDKLPMWTLISIPIARIAGDDPVTNLLLFRLVFLLFNVANVAMIVAILRRFNPRYILAGTLFYSWNPIITVIGQSKVDTVMATFIILAVLLLLYNHSRFAVVSMCLSVLVKLVTLPLLAVYWLRDVKLRKWRELSFFLFLGFATILVTSVPFWQDASMIEHTLGVALGELGAYSAHWGKWISYLGFGFLCIGVGLTQDGTEQNLFVGWSWILLYVSLVLVPVSYARYMIVAIAIASIACDWRVVALTTAVTFSSFLFKLWYSTSTRDFSLPELFSFPKSVVFALPAILILFYISLVKWKRKVPVQVASPAFTNQE